jgi:hypothetical protein
MYGRIPGNKPEDAHLRVGKYVADMTVPGASVSHAGRFFMGNAGNTNSGFAKKELCNLSRKVCKFEQFKENR